MRGSLSNTLGRPPDRRARRSRPRACDRAARAAGAGRNLRCTSLPLTRTLSSGPMRWPTCAGSPLTLTRPATIHSSISRREPRPASASALCSLGGSANTGCIRRPAAPRRRRAQALPMPGGLARLAGALRRSGRGWPSFRRCGLRGEFDRLGARRIALSGAAGWIFCRRLTCGLAGISGCPRSITRSISVSGGNSERLRRPRSSRNLRVVAYSAGRPGASRWPTASIQPRAFQRLQDVRRHGDAANVLDVAARHRLAVGDDGQRFHHRARILRRLVVLQAVEVGLVLRPGLEAPAGGQLHQFDAAVRPVARAGRRAGCARCRRRTPRRTASSVRPAAAARRPPAARSRARACSLQACSSCSIGPILHKWAPAPRSG